MVDAETVITIIGIVIITAPIWMLVLALAGLVLVWILMIPVIVIQELCKCLLPPPGDTNHHQDLAQFRSQGGVNRRPEQAPAPQQEERSVFVKKYLYSRTLQEGESTRLISTVIAATDDESQEEEGGIATSICNVVENSTKSIVESVRSVVAPKQECSICLQQYEEGQTVCWAKNEACNHMYHQECIGQWLDKHDDCPLCRTKLLVGDYSEE